jgi:hypothetical protein
MKPITAVIKEKGGAVTYPSNQEVTLNADGSGGPIYNNSPAQFGPQGLGRKGNNGYKIGSEDAPTKKKFEKHNMYSKDGKVEVAKTKEKHLSLEKKGYGHSSPAKKKDACYSKVKSRYKKWPSAYASGALVKCRKVGAANWGNKSK